MRNGGDESDHERLAGQTLAELGERTIISTLIEPLYTKAPSALVGIGDDAAAMDIRGSDGALVVTTDPAPEPVAWQLGARRYDVFGWYSVLINASDLASMGARPLGIVLSIEAPPHLLVTSFREFLGGVQLAAAEFQCPVLGGNIREGVKLSAVGTALGLCAPSKLMTRSRAGMGELVVVIGELGTFASAVLASLHSLEPPDEDVAGFFSSSLNRPIARVREGIRLAELGFASACMDASDGLINCFREIARRSQVNIHVDLSGITIPEPARFVSDALDISPEKLMMCWGDWQLVATVPASRILRLQEEMKAFGTRVSVVGRTEAGLGEVIFDSHYTVEELSFFDNEKFSQRSSGKHRAADLFELAKFTRPANTPVELNSSPVPPPLLVGCDLNLLRQVTAGISVEAELTALTAQQTRIENSAVGLYKSVPVRYFIGFDDLVGDEIRLSRLAMILCAHIREHVEKSPMTFHKIAAPLGGNPGLVIKVATLLRIPPVFVDFNPPSPSDQLSGHVHPGENIVIVHDVLLTGLRLSETTHVLRHSGARVEHVFALVERTDSAKVGLHTPSQELEGVNVALHAALALDDEKLEALWESQNGPNNVS